jgi:serine/threonine protein kinase
VMMTKDGHVKLADFGIARIESSVMTQAGTILGTPAYMSPEQLMAQTVDARSDIYSSGVLLYQLLTGERPFEGGLTAIIHKALNTTPPRPSELSVTAPPSMDAVVARAMARRPGDRYPNAAAFAGAIREAFEAPETGLAGVGLGLDEEATMVVSPPRPAATREVAPPPPPRSSRQAKQARGSSPIVLGGAGVVLLGLIGGGAWFSLRPSPPPHSAAETKRPDTTIALPVPPANPATPSPDLTAGTKPSDTTPAPPVPPANPMAPSPDLTAGTKSPDTTPARPIPPANPTAPSPDLTAVTQPSDTTPVPPVPPMNSTAPSTDLTAGAKPSNTILVPPVRPMNPTAPSPDLTAGTKPSDTTPALAIPPANPHEVSPSDQPLAPSVTPPPEHVAMAQPNLAAIREALRSVSSSARCALPRFSVSDEGRISVAGLVGAGGPDAALRDAVQAAAGGAPLVWDARSIDGGYCDVLDAIRPLSQPSSPFLGLTLAGDVTRLKEGVDVVPIVRLPEFPAYLQVDYVQHDGQVAHVSPTNGKPPWAANTTKSVDGFGTVGPPFGTDIIVAIASSAPLFPHVRPDETMRTYLPALKAAIEAAQRRGTKVTGRALVVDTVKR